MTKTAKIRLGLLCCLFFIIELLVVFFAGIGYFVLIVALHMAVAYAGFYSDSLYIALCGKEQHSAKVHELAKARSSRVNRILAIVVPVGFFALAILGILKVNFKFIDFF